MAQEQPHGNDQRLGYVSFATFCNESAQSDVNLAVALLHSFQFSRAIVNAVLQEDTTCAIAYWGISLSDWCNPFAPGAKYPVQLQLGWQSAEGGNALGAKSERERAYLAAVGKLYSNFESTPQQARLLAYGDAMGAVASKYPEDREAQIFYALALAVVQFEATFKKEPRHFRSLYGAAHAAQLSGSRDLSHKYFAELLTVCAHSDMPGRPEIREARRALSKQQT